MKRVLMPIGILGACVLIAFILVRNPTVVEETAPEIQPVAVRVAEVSLTTVQLTVEAQGKVQAAQQASVSAAVAGPVAWISPVMEAGGYAAVGEVLLRIDPSDYETALARSRATLEQARAEADHASNELNRLTELAERRLASDSQLQDTRRQANVAAARLADAEAGYQQAELDLRRTEITAPFNAIVESRDVELGQYVNRAQAVAVLYGADIVEVRVPLAIQQLGFLDISLIQRGELSPEMAPDVTIKGNYAGREYHWAGKMVRTEASIDPNSNTVQSIIRVEQQSSDSSHGRDKERVPLPIGLYVQAEIAGRTLDDIIAVPRSVVRNNNQVLVVDQENKMYFREVEIFRLEEDRVLISGGLLPGEVICISPIQAVVNGMLVQPQRDMI